MPASSLFLSLKLQRQLVSFVKRAIYGLLWLFYLESCLSILILKLWGILLCFKLSIYLLMPGLAIEPRLTRIHKPPVFASYAGLPISHWRNLPLSSHAKEEPWRSLGKLDKLY